MKVPAKRFKTPQIGLKELEPFVRNGQHLETGRPLASFHDGRSREILANWMICAALNAAQGAERFTFFSDTTGGDGIIFDGDTKTTFQTEHIMVPSRAGSDDADLEALISAAILQKCEKGGAAYASGKTLVVFLNAHGMPWFPNKAARSLPEPLPFETVWVVGFRGVERGQYIYNVAVLDIEIGDAPTWMVTVADTFDRWTVEAIQ